MSQTDNTSNSPAEDVTPEQLEEAREAVTKMQFLNKLHSEAESLEAELEEMI